MTRLLSILLLLLLAGCGRSEHVHRGKATPPPQEIQPPGRAAAIRAATTELEATVTPLSNGCVRVSGRDRRGNPFTVTNCPDVRTNLTLAWDRMTNAVLYIVHSRRDLLSPWRLCGWTTNTAVTWPNTNREGYFRVLPIVQG